MVPMASRRRNDNRELPNANMTHHAKPEDLRLIGFGPPSHADRKTSLGRYHQSQGDCTQQQGQPMHGAGQVMAYRVAIVRVSMSRMSQTYDRHGANENQAKKRAKKGSGHEAKKFGLGMIETACSPPSSTPILAESLHFRYSDSKF